jgi:CO dehydrogenase nickel-insertion accessory protein CooC1
MTVTIALAGKGGVGKTTIAAMVVKYLKVQNKPGRYWQLMLILAVI